MTTPPIIDTHAHLCGEEFRDDLPDVLKRAWEKGIARVIAVGETFSDAEKNLKLFHHYPMILPSAGLYPTILDIAQARKVHDFIITHQDKLVAIGEVGLDYWKVQAEEEREVQREIFKSFIRLSKKIGLPLNIHSRSAGRHAIDLLLSENAEKVQLHAFDGKASVALKGVEAGFFFSIPPSVARSRQKQKLVRTLPLTALLAETDSPVLGPDPGARNEPKNILRAIEAIAEIKQIAVEKVKEALFENTLRLYGNLLPREPA